MCTQGVWDREMRPVYDSVFVSGWGCNVNKEGVWEREMLLRCPHFMKFQRGGGGGNAHKRVSETGKCVLFMIVSLFPGGVVM